MLLHEPIQLLTDLNKRIREGFPSLSSTSTSSPCSQVTSEMSQALPTFPPLPASRPTFSPKKTLLKHKKLVKCGRRPKPNVHRLEPNANDVNEESHAKFNITQAKCIKSNVNLDKEFACSFVFPSNKFPFDRAKTEVKHCGFDLAISALTYCNSF